MSIQYIVDGSAKNSIARFAPKHAVTKPNVKQPHKAPMFEIDPMFETWLLDSGPVISGVFSDNSLGSDGLRDPRMNISFHLILCLLLNYWIIKLPMMHPWDSMIKLPKNVENKLNEDINKCNRKHLSLSWCLTRNRCIILMPIAPLIITVLNCVCHDEVFFLVVVVVVMKSLNIFV